MQYFTAHIITLHTYVDKAEICVDLWLQVSLDTYIMYQHLHCNHLNLGEFQD